MSAWVGWYCGKCNVVWRGGYEPHPAEHLGCSAPLTESLLGDVEMRLSLGMSAI